ncbi:MAG: Ldh family oxidoreductase, partial [Planctomycetota bacterium]
MEKVRYSPEKLTTFVRDLFRAAGVGESEASEVATSLIESNLRGHESHGVLRVGDYLDGLRTGELCSGVEWQVLTETPAVLVADGRRGFGQVLARRLVVALAEKCRPLGIA